MIKMLREFVDYIKFTMIENKKIVIYSERNVYYKYLKYIIDDILSETGEDILYITSDDKDNMFKNDNKRIKVFYINKLIKPFMEYLNCKILITTLTELGYYYFPMSKYKNIKYLYFFHAVVSTNMMYKENAFDNYDAIFCVGQHHNKEIRELEEKGHLKKKELINYGYPLIKELKREYKNNKQNKDRTVIVIAPSWHDENIINTVLYEILDNVSSDYNIIIRPHPEYIKRYKYKIDELRKIKKNNVFIDLNMLSNDFLYNSDILITDWSGVAFEYAFASLNPVVFINTPKKVNNKRYSMYKNKPIEITLRNKIGIELDFDDVKNIGTYINKILENKQKYTKIIKELESNYIYAESEENAINYIKKLIY